MSSTGVEFGIGAWGPGTPRLALAPNLHEGSDPVYFGDSDGRRYFEMVDEYGVATGYDLDTLRTDVDTTGLTQDEMIDLLGGGMHSDAFREICMLGLADLIIDHRDSGTLDELSELLGIGSIEEIEGAEISRIIYSIRNTPREIERVRTNG